jgi:hypothetical protein
VGPWGSAAGDALAGNAESCCARRGCGLKLFVYRDGGVPAWS